MSSLPANLPNIATATAADMYRLQAQEGPCPEAPGVYAFWKGDVCRYVGESRNIRKRIATHERVWWLRDCRLRWLVCANHKDVEVWLIKALNPTDNGKHPNWHAMEADWAKNEHLQAGYPVLRDGRQCRVAVNDLTDQEIRALMDEHERLTIWHVNQAAALAQYKRSRQAPPGVA